MMAWFQDAAAGAGLVIFMVCVLCAERAHALLDPF